MTVSIHKRWLAAAMLLAAAGGVHSHQIWFEPEGRAIVLRYGELEASKHERSPGGLDRFAELSATWLTAAGDRPLALAKGAEGFAVAGIAAHGESFIAIDKRYPMFDTKRDGKLLRTWWLPSTRWVTDLRSQEPKLPLDIVPTGASVGDAAEFRIVFRGEPLAGAKMALVAPSGRSTQATSDVDGRFSFALPWRGFYLIEIYHLDEVAGERQGEAYQLEGYNTTLSFHRRSGLTPPVAARTLPTSIKK